MSEETKKPTTITLKFTIPTPESFLEGIKKLYPMVEIEVEGDTEEEPSDPPP